MVAEKTAESGIDGATLESLYADVARESHHDLKGIVIVRNGRLAGEQYFNGDSVDISHDIRSATKSITSNTELPVVPNVIVVRVANEHGHGQCGELRRQCLEIADTHPSIEQGSPLSS